MDGQIIATFANGFLCDLSLELATPITEYQYMCLFTTVLPYQEKDIKGQWAKIEEAPINVKIAAFCEAYMLYNKGLKYKVGAGEPGKLTNLLVTKQLLTTYFTSKNFVFKNKWSISNFCKYYNELRAEARGAYEFPNYWDEKFAATLTAPKYLLYVKHLRSLGLKEGSK